MISKFHQFIINKGVQATVLVGKRDLHYGNARMLQNMYETIDPNYPSFVVRNDDELHRAIRDLLG